MMPSISATGTCATAWHDVVRVRCKHTCKLTLRQAHSCAGAAASQLGLCIPAWLSRPAQLTGKKLGFTPAASNRMLAWSRAVSALPGPPMGSTLLTLSVCGQQARVGAQNLITGRACWLAGPAVPSPQRAYMKHRHQSPACALLLLLLVCCWRLEFRPLPLLQPPHAPPPRTRSRR